MTTGNTTTGYVEAVTTANYGLSYIYENYKTRLWSGGDSFRAPKTYEYFPIRRTRVLTRVRNGKSFVVIKMVGKTIRRRVIPKRAAMTENDFRVNIMKKTDLLCTEIQESGGVVYSTYTASSKNLGWGNYGFTFDWTPNDDIELLSKFRTKIAGSSFNAGVFLGEGHQALNMISNAATRIAKALISAKKLDFASAAKHLVGGTKRDNLRRKSSSNWLELQYGWLPLLHDAKDGAEFLAHNFAVPLQTIVRVRRYKEGSRTGAGVPTFFKAGTQVQVKATIKERDIVALAGLTDPASVAWELLPYSFIVDWFIPIGDYLAARGLTQALTATYVRSQYNVGNASGIAPNQKGPDFKIVGDPQRKEFYFDGTRGPTPLNVPLPAFKPLSSVLSWKRAANAVALLVQKTPR